MGYDYTRLKLILLVLFAVGGVALWAHDALYVWPRQHCEAHGHWWDARDRVCATPVPLTIWTHRPGPVARPAEPH